MHETKPCWASPPLLPAPFPIFCLRPSSICSLSLILCTLTRPSLITLLPSVYAGRPFRLRHVAVHILAVVSLLVPQSLTSSLFPAPNLSPTTGQQRGCWIEEDRGGGAVEEGAGKDQEGPGPDREAPGPSILKVNNNPLSFL